MIKSNKITKNSCGLMINLYDISTTRSKQAKLTKLGLWTKLFRENCSPIEAYTYIEKIDFVNSKQKEEVMDLIVSSYSDSLLVLKNLNAERVSGYTSVIKNFCGKDILISVDSIYEINGEYYGLIAKDKYKDRYKKKYLFDMGLSKCSYEGKLACLYLEPQLKGIIFVDLHPFFAPKQNDIEEFAFSHFSFYDLNVKDDLIDLENLLLDCSKKDNCYLCKFKIFCNEQKVKEFIPFVSDTEDCEKKTFVLTDSQSDFAKNIAGINRVNALAGSGKTSTLSQRIINLLNNGYTPEEILCISFTNNAVMEMKNKIANFTNCEISERCNIYTFHGFCQKILQENFTAFGYERMPTIANKVDKLKLLNEVLDKMPKITSLRYEDPLMNLRNAKGVIFETYNYIEEYLKRGSLENKELELPISEISKELNKSLIRNNLIDLNSLLYTINNSSVLSSYKYKHIMLDEAQDSSKVQFEILTKLSKSAISLSVIGDMHQNVFGWLYLDVENLIKFSDNFASVKDYYFKENFRSTKEIIELANKLILKGPKIQALISGDKPSFIKIEDYYEINEIVKKHNNKEFGTIGIISRTKNLCDMLSLQFNSKAQYLFRNELIISITNLAEYILYGTNSKSVLEYLKYTDKLNSNYSIDDIKSSYETKVKELQELKRNFEYYTDDKHFFLYLLGYIKDYDKVLSNINFDKFKTLNDIYLYLKECIMFDDDTTFSTQNESNITFSTAHASKGSEFDTCIILLDKFDLKTDEDLRLLYVAITRAKKNLYIVYKTPNDDILNLLMN